MKEKKIDVLIKSSITEVLDALLKKNLYFYFKRYINVINIFGMKNNKRVAYNLKEIF